MSSNYKRGLYINGDMLKAVMKIRGISQIELAEEVGVHRNTIGAAINKNRIERKEKIYQICKALNVFPDLLLKPIYELRRSGNSACVIDASNISDFIDSVSFESPDKDISFTDGTSDFFNWNSFETLLDEEAKKEIYWNCMEYKNLLIDLYFKYLNCAAEDQSTMSFSDFIRHKMIALLKKKGYH